VALIAALPEREPQQSGRQLPSRCGDDRAPSLIESEIVIVDDDGREEPFDPAAWFS
jgi:hypothetical protein